MLPQPLHIFRKDLRHLWPETLVGIFLLIAFAWSAPYKGVESPFSLYAGILDAFLHILIPIAWLVIISRLIHDEPLVGDRQFWTSRPYHWAKLLLAKLLYLVAFIYLPFFLMQVYLLKHAGLHPATVIPALLYNLLLLTVIIIVPLSAIAAVTTTFARMLLSVLGGLIYVIVLVALAGYFRFEYTLPPHINAVAVAVLILLPAIALIYQYARRRTAISRIILVAAPLVATLLFLLTPATALIRSGYPVIPAAGGPRLTPFPVPENPKATLGQPRLGPRNTIQIALPFQVEGVDRKDSYIIAGTAITLSSPSVNWSSPYRNSFFGPGQITGSPYTIVSTTLPADIFSKIHATPVDLHLSIATEHLRADKTSAWPSTFQPFDIPGHGRCTFSHDDANTPAICRFPFETPKFLFLNAIVSADCTVPGAPSTGGSQIVGGQPTTLNFDPIVAVSLEPSTGSPQRRGHLCPGTLLNFTQNTSLGNARLEIDDKQVVLDPLAARIPPPQAAQPAPLEQPQ